jgi:hypothetical protein
MKIAPISSDMIRKTVAVSQKIEGYQVSDDKTLKTRIQSLMARHNVKVSLQK